MTVQEAVGGAESFESVYVRIDPAPTDDVTTGRGKVDLAEAGQGWAGQQDGSPDEAGLLHGDLRAGHPVAVDPEGPRLRACDRRPHALQDEEQGLDVADLGHVVQGDRLFGEQAGSDYRQSGVLVARRLEVPVQPGRAPNEEACHPILRVAANGPNTCHLSDIDTNFSSWSHMLGCQQSANRRSGFTPDFTCTPQHSLSSLARV